MKLRDKGYDIYRTSVTKATLSDLRSRAFADGVAGTRCLLDEPVVREVAREIRAVLVADGFMPDGSMAIQAIAFDKTSDANWKVTWHQDVMFPFAQRVTHETFALGCIKEGINFARPPREILEELLAVRLHVDDCDESNGPLRVCPSSHQFGIFKSAEIHDYLARHGEAICVAREGEALLMRPLLLHASSLASQPKHRRVLHLVFHTGRPIPEKWHRAVR